ncbi:alpha beta hydrolase domain containing protein [Stylonychia lemnae]|uniref:Alpha beta hydrolase domain containing protein n=1 Tax=Stylonychia lemnae TaxID=5949 RepID=A0A077ZNP8_STYLE|nr:alpha beta hydrolase domain containing protein [Stylonychia lemnae]|eukprot:CDW71099.1 alpha beta hydrolase domain containing protein [Stylonychia lemnae]
MMSDYSNFIIETANYRPITASILVIIGTIIIGFYLYLKSVQTSKINLYYKLDSKVLKPALENKTLIHMNFKQCIFLFNNFFQSLVHQKLAKVIEGRTQIKFVRELFTFKDGGMIAIDWVNEISPKNDQKPLLIISPGLGGEYNFAYNISVAEEGLANGYSVVIIGQRGASGIPLTTPYIYCASSAQDIREPVEYLYNNYCVNEDKQKIRQIFYVAISFTGSILSHYLGEDGDKHKIITAAAAVCSPMRIWLGIKQLKATYNGIFYKHFGQKLRTLFYNNARVLRGMFKEKFDVDIDNFIGENSNAGVDEFNDLIAKMNKYKSSEDYYHNGSFIHILPQIRVPIMYFYSEDDPVIGKEQLDLDQSMKNPYVLVATTKKGAHVSHFESYFNPRMWFRKPVIQFLNSFRNDVK